MGPKLGRSEKWLKCGFEGSGTGWVNTSKKVLVRNDLETEATFADERALLDEGLRSLIRVPLVAGDKVVGTLNFISRGTGAFRGREQAIVERLAPLVAPGIENARLYREAQERTRELEVVDEVASIMASSLRLQEVYERFTSGVRRLVEFDRMSIVPATEDLRFAIDAYTVGLAFRYPWLEGVSPLGRHWRGMGHIQRSSPR